ncbi:MAG: helix-turn-helix domain-containing protein [Alphaproteobacteria bacterium]|nr:helix-turn-helix domain-containing protein [Alphaproteobacteria bacterium]
MPNVIDARRPTASEPRLSTYKSQSRQLSQLVRAFVSRQFNVSVDELVSAQRGSSTACHARQVAMYLTHVVFGVTLTSVGDEFGRDRSTVSHACRQVEWARDDVVFDQLLSRLEWQLRAATGKEV